MAAPGEKRVGSSTEILKKHTLKKRKIDHDKNTGADDKIESQNNGKTCFTEIDFKFGLRDSSTTFQVLEEFVKAASSYPEASDYDIVENYCKSSEECVEIMKLLEGGKRKPKELCLIFEALEAILVAIAGRLSRFRPVGLAVVRRFLASHLGHAFSLMQPHNKSHHLKAAMKLLSAFVMQGGSAPRDVQVQVDLQHRAFPTLLARKDRKDSFDVRDCTLHFMLSFLIVGDNDVIRQLLQTKGFLHNIFSGLYADKLSTLQMVLPTLTEKIVQNTEISKTLKVRLFSQHALTELASLYNWKGPQQWSKSKGNRKEVAGLEDEEENTTEAQMEERQVVADMVHQLLVQVCCDFKLGINFYDKSYGTSSKSLNHILTGFLKSLTQPYCSRLPRELIIKLLRACPDQLTWYLPELRHALTPRISSKWVAAIGLLYEIYQAQPLVAPCMKLRERVPVHKLVSMAAAMVFPPKEVWLHIISSIRHKSPVVQHEGLTVILLVLKRVKATLNFCQDENPLYSASELDTIQVSFKETVAKLCPDLVALLGCWSHAVKSGVTGSNEPPQEEEKKDGDDMDVDDVIIKGFPVVARADLLLVLLRALVNYQAIFPEVFAESPVNFGLLLEGIRPLAADAETSTYQVSLLQLHLLRLLSESHLRQITWLKESFCGRSTLYLLLEMVTMTHSSPRMTSVATNLLQKLLTSTGLFEHTSEELAVWLSQLALAASTETHLPVLTFVEKVFSAVLRDPFSYTEQVREAAAEAATEEAALVEGEAASGMSSAPFTSEKQIEAILLMNESDVTSASDMDIRTDHIDKDDQYSWFSFSLLVPAALKLFTEHSQSLQDPSDMEAVTTYLTNVIHEVLHRQINPAALCIMLRQHDALKLQPLATRWLPDSLASATTVASIKSPVKAKKLAKRIKEASSLDVLLTLTFTGGSEFLLDNTYQKQLQTACQSVTLEESEFVVRKILLYLRTYGLSISADKNNCSIVKFYLELLIGIFSSLVSSAPQTGHKSANSHPSKVIEEVKTSDDSEVDDVNSEDGSPEEGTGNGESSVGNSADPMGSLETPTLTHQVALERLLFLVATHPDLQQWFLYSSPNSSAREVSDSLRKAVSPALARLLVSVPHTLTPGLPTSVVDAYATKAVCELTAYVERQESEEASNDVKEEHEILSVMGALIRTLPWNLTIKVAQNLSKLSSGTLLYRNTFSQHGRLLIDTLTHIVSSIRADSRLVLNITEKLPLQTVSKLCSLAIKKNLPQLDRLIFELLTLSPIYSVATSEAYLVHCLQSSSGDTAMQTAAILIGHSAACQTWYRAFQATLSENKRNQRKWDEVGVVLQYLPHLVSESSYQTEVASIRHRYWSELQGWVQGEVDPEEPSTSSRLRLLTILTETFDDLESLQASWSEVLTSLVSCSQLTVAQVQYTWALSMAVFRCDPERQLPVWPVWVGAWLGALPRLLAGNARTRNRLAVEQLLSHLLELLKDPGTDLKSLLEVVEPVWEQTLKVGLKHLYNNETMLRVLVALIGVIYPEKTPKNISASLLYQMVMSHSQFLTVLLDEQLSPLKDALVELLLTVARLDPSSCCQSSHVAPLLGAYSATLHPTDQKLLLLIRLYETSGCSLKEHRPFLWGPKAVEHYSVKKNLGPSLWKKATSEQVLEVLDTEKLEKAMLAFPLQRRLRPIDVEDPVAMATQEDVYDPCFLLPLIGHLLSPGYVVKCFNVVEMGCLSYLLVALSCHDADLRGAAYHALTEFYHQVEGARFPGKEQVQYLLDVVRNSVVAANSKLATVVTVFLARAARLMVTPDAPLYSAVNEFLLLKPAIDVLDVPEFYKLFNSNSLEFKMERSWILSLLIDGLRDTSDYRLFDKRYVFKLILAFHDSILSDTMPGSGTSGPKHLVLKVVAQAVRQRIIAGELVKHHGMIAWLNNAILSSTSDPGGQCLLVEILQTLWATMVPSIPIKKETEKTEKPQRHLPWAFTNELLHTILHLLQTLRGLEDMSVFHKLIDCLASLLMRRRASVTKMSHTPSIYVRLDVIDILHLLHTWNSLIHSEVALVEVEALADVFGLSLTVTVNQKTRVKRHGRQHGGPTRSSTQTVERAGTLQRECICKILQVITHWTPEMDAPLADTRKHQEGITAVLMYVAAWCLDHVSATFSDDLNLLLDVLCWLRSWVRHPAFVGIRRVLSSDTHTGSNLISQLLSVYGHCSAYTYTPSDKCCKNQPLKEHALIMKDIQGHVTEMLAAVIDLSMHESHFQATALQRELKRATFSSALEKVANLQGAGDTLRLLMQELWMHAERPMHFTVAVEDRVQNLV